MIKKKFLLYITFLFLIPVLLYGQYSPDYKEAEFSVMSYNVHELRILNCYPDDHFTESLYSILYEIHPNIVAIQEAFCYSAYNAITSTQSPHLPILYYESIEPIWNGSGEKVFGNGLALGSDFYIYDIEKIAWNACYGESIIDNHLSDCPADKGFTFCRIDIPASNDGAYFFSFDFYNLHMDAGMPIEDAETRRLQITQLSSFIDDHSNGRSIIIAGDFNFSDISGYDSITMSDFKNSYNLKISCPTNIITNPEYGQKFDYILYRSSNNIIELADEEEPCKVRSDIEFSDHYPVLANFHLTELPDIQIDELYIEPGNPVVGETVDIYATVINRGPGATPKREEIWVTIDINGTPTDVFFVENMGEAAPLLVEQYYEGKVTVEWEEGMHTIKARADSIHLIPEINEENNSRILNLEPMPDIVITNAWTQPSNPEAGQNVTIFAAVKNTGTLATPENIDIRTSIKINNNELGHFFVTDSNGNKKSLGVNESFTGQSNLNWTATNGTHTLEVIADEPNIIEESDESNSFISSIQVGNNEILISRPASGNVWRIGSAHEIEYTLPANYPGGGLSVLLHGPVSGIIRSVIDSEWDPNNPGAQHDWSWHINTLENGTPVQPGGGYQIELISNSDSSINGMSASFSVGEMGIIITTPTEGEEIGIGTEYRKVRWIPPVVSLPPGTADDLRMILLKNGAIYKSGTIYEFVGNDGDKTWYVGNLLDGQPIETGTGYQIKLEVKYDTNYVGFSPSFSIVSYATPSIQMTSPNGGETLTLGENHTFTWSTNGFPVSENIGLKIIKNEVALGYIAAPIPNTGSYDMALSTLTDGQAIEPGNDYKIEVRVMDTGNGIFEDRSDQNFTILTDESICTETWQPANSPVTNQINDLIFVNDGFMAAAGGRIILTSVDGIVWNFIDTGVAGNNLAITYGNNQYVVTGTDGLILTSPDGTTWTQQTSGVSVKLRDVIWANSLYIAVGFEGTILTSPDGITWTVQTSGTNNILYNIAYGNNTYVAVGEAGLVLVSPDGVTWSEVNSGTSSYLFQVAYLNGQFFALGDIGIILTSPDGINWTSRTSGTTERLYGIGYELSRYVVTGNAGTILTSSDGTTWTAQNSGITTNLLWGIAYGNGKLVVGGADGTILYSQCPTQTISVMSPNGGEDLAAGSTYMITWNASNITENIKINLYKGNHWYGNIVRDIPVDQGYYNWPVGSLSNGETAPEGTDYKILVRIIENGPYDRSDGNFTISNNATIEVLSPNGGETFYRHNNLTVTWVSNQTENVNISLLQNGTVLGRIASNVANSGNYTWEIQQLENGVLPDYESDYQVRVETVSGTVHDTSDANFVIAKPFITFQKPQEGNTYAYGEKIYIEWTTTGINKGSITLYMNRYTSTESYNIATYSFDKGTATYTVETSIPADYYKIKGIWTVDSSVYSKSGKFLVTE